MPDTPVTERGTPSGPRRPERVRSFYSWRMLPPAADPFQPSDARDAVLGGRPWPEVARDARRRLADRFDATEVVLTGSGTHALTLAFRAVTHDSESSRIALPAWSCYQLLTAAAGAACRVRFYDLDPATLAPDPSSLEAALDAGVEAVVVAHLYGFPAVSDRVLEAVEDAGAVLVEDAAQAAGGRYRGRPLGSFGELSVLSFGRGKGWSGGGGGALLIRDGFEAPAGILPAWDREFHAGGLVSGEEQSESEGAPARRGGWKELGLALGQWALGRPSLYRIPASLPFLGLGETGFEEPTEPEPMPGRALRLLLRALESRSGDELRTRRDRAHRLEALLDDRSAERLVRPLEGGEPGMLRRPVLLGPGQGAPSLGILPAYPRTLPELDVVPTEEEAPVSDYPGARILRDRLFTLPVHSRMGERDLRAVARWVQDMVDGSSPRTEDDGVR